MQELTSEESRLGRRRLLWGVLTLAAGVGLLLWGMFGSVFSILLVVAAGGALAMVGVAALSPVAARPMARSIGWPVARLFGVSGRLAQRNAMRSPSRTSRTAAALMVGIGLVAFVAVMGDSLKASTAGAIDRAVRADFIVQPVGSTFGAAGFSPQLADRMARVPGIGQVVAIESGIWSRNGVGEAVQGVDAVQLGDVFATTTVAGDAHAAAAGGLAVSQSAASANHLHVGDAVTVTFPSQGDVTLTVSMIFNIEGSSLNFFVSPATFARGFSSILDGEVALRLARGADQTKVSSALTAIAADYPNAQLLDQAAYKQSQIDNVNQLLGLIYTLLALAIVIALLGIMNTLALAVIERTRELGLLRAVGLSRRETRTMIKLEAVIVAVFGAILGVTVGVVFGWMAVQAMGTSSPMVFSAPTTELVMFVGLGALGGVVAAGWPARRASRVDILRAVSSV